MSEAHADSPSFPYFQGNACKTAGEASSTDPFHLDLANMNINDVTCSPLRFYSPFCIGQEICTLFSLDKRSVLCFHWTRDLYSVLTGQRGVPRRHLCRMNFVVFLSVNYAAKVHLIGQLTVALFLVMQMICKCRNENGSRRLRNGGNEHELKKKKVVPKVKKKSLR